MIYNIHYDVCSIAISILTVICVLTTKDIERQENKAFLLIVMNGLLSGIFDIASAVANSFPAEFPRFTLEGLNFMYLVLHACVAMQFYIYIRLNGGRDIRFDLRHPSPYMIPLAITLAVMLLNPFLHWVYYFDENLRYCHGPMIYWMYASGGIYILMAFLDVAHYRKTTPWKRKALLLAFIAAGLLTVVIQMMFPNILIELFMQSVVFGDSGFDR